MKLIDTNRFYLAGTNNRFLHLASIQDGFKEYMCFSDKATGQIYIESISGGTLEFIEDDSLADELCAFLTSKGVLNIDRPVLPDDTWHSLGKKTK